MKLVLLLSIAFATGACAKPMPAHTLPESPARDFHRSCSEGGLPSCAPTPAAPERAPRVDTNLTSPRALSPSVG